jgi:hypothetical protein
MLMRKLAAGQWRYLRHGMHVRYWGFLDVMHCVRWLCTRSLAVNRSGNAGLSEKLIDAILILILLLSKHCTILMQCLGGTLEDCK